jgi:hypothetical protein
MPAFAALTVSDGQATPVNHTFSPSGLSNDASNLAKYADRSGGVAIGFPRVALSLREPMAAKPGQASATARVYRVGVTVKVPKLETLGTNDQGITPPPTLAYTAMFSGEFVIPERASLQDRKDILAYVKNLLANAVTTSLVQDLDPVY